MSTERETRQVQQLAVCECMKVINNSGSESNSQRMVSSIWDVLFWKLSTEYLLMRVKEESKKAALQLDIKKN